MSKSSNVNSLQTSLGLSVILTGLLALNILAADTGARWPLEQTIDLSSGYGDFREGHFHAGIDLRTGGETGLRVKAPADGYIWRIRMSYSGYGKALYLMGDDGAIYVFAHLMGFMKPVDQYVKSAQMDSQRYYQDLSPVSDQFPVKAGDVIGFSGQSGSGAPHLHFEKRSAKPNLPVNPLKHGYQLNDATRPVITRLGFQLTDDSALFADGQRKQIFEVRSAGDGKYRFDSLLYFDREFGLLVDGFDQMRIGGMKQSIDRFQVFIDDQPLYTVGIDTLDYDAGYLVRLEYDYVEVVKGNKRTRRLHKTTGNDFSASGGPNHGRGIIGRDFVPTVGRHRARVVGTDASGNSSELAFDFLWGPPGDIYTLDSTVEVASDTTDFFLSPMSGYEVLGIDSAVALRNARGAWGKPGELEMFDLKDGRLGCRVTGHGVERVVLRLFLFSDKGVIRDVLFNGILVDAPDRCTVIHEVLEDGLLVHVDARVINGALGHIRLYYQDSLLGWEPLQYLDMKRHACFIPPQPKYEHIDRIGVAMNRDTTAAIFAMSDSLSIHLVGHRRQQTIRYDDYLSLKCERDDFFAPRYIEIKSSSPNRIALKLNSDHYQILPEAFPVMRPFEMTIKTLTRRANDWVSGICWLDAENDRWVWLDNERDDSLMRAQTNGGGSFAAVFDQETPIISRLSIRNEQTIANARPRISFILEDTLSGIGDDRNISIKIDGQWQIPEYEPDTRLCTTRPVEPLSQGRHHLAIEVTDRAGLKTEQYLQFNVKSKR